MTQVIFVESEKKLKPWETPEAIELAKQIKLDVKQ